MPLTATALKCRNFPCTSAISLVIQTPYHVVHTCLAVMKCPNQLSSGWFELRQQLLHDAIPEQLHHMIRRNGVGHTLRVASTFAFVAFHSPPILTVPLFTRERCCCYCEGAWRSSARTHIFENPSKTVQDVKKVVTDEITELKLKRDIITLQK